MTSFLTYRQDEWRRIVRSLYHDVLSIDLADAIETDLERRPNDEPLTIAIDAPQQAFRIEMAAMTCGLHLAFPQSKRIDTEVAAERRLGSDSAEGLGQG